MSDAIAFTNIFTKMLVNPQLTYVFTVD